MFKTKRNFFKKAMSFIVASGMLATCYVPEVKAENENPSGYLTGITDSLDDIPNNWYVQPNTDFYNTINNYDTYSNNYNSENTALQISTKEQLAAFAQVVNEGKYVKLVNDIGLQGSGVTFTNSSSGDFNVVISKTDENVDPSNLWSPVGYGYTYKFQGTFDGQGHLVTNMLAIDKPDSGSGYAGLFGYCGDQATIRNIGIAGNSNSYAYSNYSITAGIAGCNGGQVK